MVHSRPGIKVPETRGLQQFNGPYHLAVTAPPIRIAAVPVVGRLIPIDGNADLDLVRREELAEIRTKPHTIGMDPEVEMAAPARTRPSSLMIHRSRSRPA